MVNSSFLSLVVAVSELIPATLTMDLVEPGSFTFPGAGSDRNESVAHWTQVKILMSGHCFGSLFENREGGRDRTSYGSAASRSYSGYLLERPSFRHPRFYLEAFLIWATLIVRDPPVLRSVNVIAPSSRE